MLRLVRSIIFTIDQRVIKLNDLSITENCIMLVFVFFTLLLGLFPNLVLNFTDNSILKILVNI